MYKNEIRLPDEDKERLHKMSLAKGVSINSIIKDTVQKELHCFDGCSPRYKPPAPKGRPKRRKQGRLKKSELEKLDDIVAKEDKRRKKTATD